MTALAPNSTIGIIGGGQLGRMLAMAAAQLGYQTVILEPDPNAPAAQVANDQIIAAYDDEIALESLADQCDVVTYEFENVPSLAIESLEKVIPVYPGAQALKISQDRLMEKQMAQGIGAKTAGFHAVNSLQDIVDIRKGQHKCDRLAIELCDQVDRLQDNRLQLLPGIGNFGLCKRNKTPIVRPCIVENAEDLRRFGIVRHGQGQQHHFCSDELVARLCRQLTGLFEGPRQFRGKIDLPGAGALDPWQLAEGQLGAYARGAVQR